MHKFLIFTNLFLFNSIISFNNFISLRFIDELDTNTTKKKKNFCEKNENNFICSNPIIFILIIIIIILLLLIISFKLLKNCNYHSTMLRYWERTVTERMNRNRINERKEKELNEKKKKYYLLNIEIKGFTYNKQLNDFGEKCPICLDNYDDNKEVCFTPCKHLFHHKCLKEYIYGIKDVKCPICKYDLYESIKDKKINYKEINIVDDIVIYNKKELNNEILQSNNNLNQENITNAQI